MSSYVVSAGSSASIGSDYQNVDVYGVLTIVSGTTVQDTIVHNGGSTSIYGSSVAVDASSGGAHIEIESGGAVKTANISGVVGSASEIVVNNGGKILENANIGPDGILKVANGGSATSASIKSGGTLVVESGAVLTDTILKSGGNIEFASYKYGSSVSAYFTPDNPNDKESSHGTITVTDGVTSETIILNKWGNSDALSAGAISIVSAADGSAEIQACFLAGCMISTPDGDVPVESLQVGDAVIVHEDGTEVASSVVWAGKAHTVVRTDLPTDLAGYPVRILKDAVSDGVPYRDMLITPEHCLYFYGRFVPARMLVNGSSIFYDTSVLSYDYYHIETSSHSIIKADGMLTESYLDTGNRHTFRQNSKVATLRIGGDKSWTADAVAALDVSRAFVEPLHQNILMRAKSMNVSINAEPIKLTQDPDLRLQTDSGIIIRPARKADGRVMFMIPKDIQCVRILSNTVRPSDAIGPFVDDRRELGVLVGDIKLFDGARTRAIDVHLHEDGLAGWDAENTGVARWTTGKALLPLGGRHTDGIGLLAIQVLSAGPYVVRSDVSKQDTVSQA